LNTASQSGAARRLRPAFLRRTEEAAFSENERRILDLIRNEGPLSRADLARRTDLALQSVIRLVDGLVAREFLKPGERVLRGGPGQPSAPMALVADGAYTFGVSIMTEGVSLLLMDLGGNIRAHREDIMDIDDRPAIIEHVRKQLSAMAQAAQIRSDRIFGAGVAASGYFVGPGEVNAPDPLKNWSLLNLEDELSAALELPVWVENNGSAAAVGESLYGAGRRYRSFAYIYMAVGVGGGVIADGRLIRGARGNAGEFTGVLPEEARANRPTMNLLLEILQARGVAVTSIDDMTKRFDPEWPGVETWLERTRPAFTAILSAIGAVTDPDVIVLGGRIPPALARLMAERAEFFQGRRRDREREFPLVIPAEVESDAAALGAAALPFKQHFFL
jgi:predicted NBD/HSP70 family sugar kinase